MPLFENTVAKMDVKGIDEMVAKLKKLPPNLRRKHLRTALRRGSVLLKNEISAQAPVGRASYALKDAETLRQAGGPPQRTRKKNRKRDAPKLRKGRLKKKSNIKIKVRKPKAGYLKVQLAYPTVGDRYNERNLYYWRFVHDGTKYQAANPYIKRSADNKFNEVVNTVVAETRKGIDEEIRKRGIK